MNNRYSPEMDWEVLPLLRRIQSLRFLGATIRVLRRLERSRVWHSAATARHYSRAVRQRWARQINIAGGVLCLRDLSGMPAIRIIYKALPRVAQQSNLKVFLLL